MSDWELNCSLSDGNNPLCVRHAALLLNVHNRILKNWAQRFRLFALIQYCVSGFIDTFGNEQHAKKQIDI